MTTFPLNRKAGRVTTPAGTPFRGVKPRRLFRCRTARGYQPRRERAEHCLALPLAGLPTAFYLRHTPTLRGLKHPADQAGHRITSPAPSELPGLVTVSTYAVTSLGRVTGRSNNACSRLPPGHSFRPPERTISADRHEKRPPIHRCLMFAAWQGLCVDSPASGFPPFVVELFTVGLVSPERRARSMARFRPLRAWKLPTPAALSEPHGTCTRIARRLWSEPHG